MRIVEKIDIVDALKQLSKTSRRNETKRKKLRKKKKIISEERDNDYR